MPESPSPLNYFEGKGILTFTPDGDSAPRDLGNAPTFKLTPNVEQRKHFSSRAGTRVVDRVMTTTKSLTVDVVLDEITIDNLALQLMGDVTENSAGDGVFEILSVSEVRGRLQLTGTNDLGARFAVDAPVVSFLPGEGFDFIGDTDGKVTLKGEVNADPTTGLFATLSMIRDGQ